MAVWDSGYAASKSVSTGGGDTEMPQGAWRLQLFPSTAFWPFTFSLRLWAPSWCCRPDLGAPHPKSHFISHSDQ